jgi:4a-hydroxytetrahydrobiopterin dehydratase
MEALSQAETEAALATLDGRWQTEERQLVRDFELADFAAAIAFVERVAAEAEAANHHPDILVHGYRHVRIMLSTHSAGGLTERDFALARTIDRF